MEAPEIILPGGPAVSGHTCRGAGHPGRGHQDPPGADRVLRLPVLRGTATRRSRRAACQLLHPPLTRLGTADTHSVPPPIGSCLDWQRHATRAAQPQTPPGRRHQDSPDPPQLARLLRRHLHAFGCAADGRLFQGARGGPLSESLYGRIWHQARAAAMPDFGTGAQPARRPYDLRHAALSLWLASGAPPAEIAARAGHSVRVLLTIYAHGIPGCDQIASQHIEQALRFSRWPPAGPQKAAQTPGIPSVMRPCHSWTQRDTAGLETSAQIRLHASDLRKYRPGGQFDGSLPRTGDPGHPFSHEPLTSQDLAHHWPTATGNGLPNRSRTRIRPGIREHRHRA
jgi:hypothetical protein